MNANLVPSIFGTTQWELRALSQLAHFWLFHKIQTIFYTSTVSSIFLLHCENYQLRWIGSREQKSKFINIMKYIRQGFHFFFSSRWIPRITIALLYEYSMFCCLKVNRFIETVMLFVYFYSFIQWMKCI